MKDHQADFIVVGAGQNQLTAAAYLAAAGHGVIVLERHPYWGGGCITQEVTLPGFRHDLHATNVFMARANPLVRHDELGLCSRFGLRYADSDQPSHGTLFDDGSAIALYQDLERSCESIGRYSAADARAYRAFVEETIRYVPLFSFALFNPPAPGDRFRSLLGASDEGRKLLSFFEATTVDVIERHFRDERTKVHMLRLTSEMMMRADRPGSAFGLMFMAGLYHSHPAGFVCGGSQGFSDALAQCIRHHGGTILTNVEVAEVLVENGCARGVRDTHGNTYTASQAVIAGLPPWRLSDFVDGTEALTEKVRQVPNSDFTCFLAHLALDEAPQPEVAPEFRQMAFTTLAPADFGAMVRMTQAAADGRIPDEFSAAYVCASNVDPQRAPPGCSTLYLYRPVPTVIANRSLGYWDTVKSSVGDELVAQTRRFVPNLTPDNVLASAYSTPADFQHESPSFLNGDVAALAMTPQQFLDGRPIPELAQYRVPGVERLYLCGPFMHPGGGANGGGRPVAMRVMMDLGMDLKKVFQI